MTDDERFLEIATRLMCALISSDHGANHTAYSSASCAVQGAEALVEAWRERTGAQRRDQDVSDRLLGYAIAALENCRRRCDEAGCAYDNCVWDEMKAEADSVQRARAAGKGER